MSHSELEASRAAFEATLFRPEPSPRREVEAAIVQRYAACGLPPPAIVWADSPVQALLVLGALTYVADVDRMAGAVAVPLDVPDSKLVADLARDVRITALPGAVWDPIQAHLGEAGWTGFVERWVAAPSRWSAFPLGDGFGWHRAPAWLGGALRDDVLALAAARWPASLAAIDARLPPAETPLDCDALGCPGERAGWQGGLRPSWSLCDRALQATEAMQDLARSHDVAMVDALGAEGLRLPAAQAAVVDAARTLRGCAGLIARPGLVLCSERPTALESGTTLVFSDGTRMSG